MARPVEPAGVKPGRRLEASTKLTSSQKSQVMAHPVEPTGVKPGRHLEANGPAGTPGR